VPDLTTLKYLKKLVLLYPYDLGSLGFKS